MTTGQRLAAALPLFIAWATGACTNAPYEDSLHARVEALERQLEETSPASGSGAAPALTPTSWAGGTGGELQLLRCPPGMAAVGADVRAGDLMDGISVVCRPVREVMAETRVQEPGTGAGQDAAVAP